MNTSIARIYTLGRVEERIAHGGRENRGEAERTLRGQRLDRTLRYEREYFVNSGKNRALSLRCVHEKAVLRRHSLKNRFPGCSTGSTRFRGEELSKTASRKYNNMIDAWGGWSLFQELLAAVKEIADKRVGPDRLAGLVA